MTTRVQLQKSDERNVHSQNGEDGVVEKIVSHLGLEGGTAVEFGAWDGVHLSNTALLRERGWTTVLIEGDSAKIPQLRKLENTRTVVIEAMVMPEGESSLDRLLDDAAVPEVDFVSIDIDGDDIHILETLKRRPKVICIEFNPTIPPPYAFANPRGTFKGSSLCAIHAVAAKLGYELVYATFCNAFFVERSRAAVFVPMEPFNAYHQVSRPAVICFYDGEFAVAHAVGGQYRHAFSTLPVYVPAIPRVLRGWPPSFGKVMLAYLYSALMAPLFYLKSLWLEGMRQVRSRRRS